MFGWIPIIGPIIDGIVSIFIKSKDVELEKYKVDGKIDVEAMRVSASIIESTKGDIGTRLARDIIMFPPAIWCALGYWDKIVEHQYPKLVWTVHSFPQGSPLEYLVYAVIAYLLGTAGLSIWRRK